MTALQASEARFQKLTENIPGMIYRFGLTPDGSSSTLYANSASYDLYEVTPEELMTGVYSLDAMIHPDDYASVSQVGVDSAQNLTLFKSEYRIITASGTVKWVQATSQPELQADGSIIWDGVMIDISERKRAEAGLAIQARLNAFRADVDSALAREENIQEMLQLCTDAVVKHLGAAFARIWTLSSDQAMLELQASSGLYTHINGGHARVPVGKFKIGLIAQEKLPHLTNDVLTDPLVGDKDWARQENMVAFAGYPLMIGGQLLGVIAMFSRQLLSEQVLEFLEFAAQEIALGIKRHQAETALRESEMQLRQQSEDLETALQELQNAQLQMIQSEKMSALGNLVAGIAHEINNPVGFISGNLNQAKQALEDLIAHLNFYRDRAPETEIATHAAEIDLDYLLQDLPQIIGSMKLGCDRIKCISTSLRTFSRADQNHQVTTNLHEGINSTILILKHRLKANNFRPAIEVVTNYGNIPAIKCFPGQLNQVFMNILANAIDALEESNIGRSFRDIEAKPNLITVKTELSDDRQSVLIRLRDNGIGMADDLKQKIFEHLFTTKSVGKGTGLGLAIARQIVVEKHQGKIEVNSTLGEGSEFVITLPLTGVAIETQQKETNSANI
ncbi:ATP-binding protein [Nostoc sp. UHCC 0302]|uniref:ATP-binding protein n=1 Tax=Nostoc sp. UHCC 0302 TaxID=3134896 RepID=UPI00311CC724